MEWAPMLENPLVRRWCVRPLSVFWETWTKRLASQGCPEPPCDGRRVSFRLCLFLRQSPISWQPSWRKVFMWFRKGPEPHSLVSLHIAALLLASEKKASPRRGTDFLLTLRTSPTHVGRSCLFYVFGIKIFCGLHLPCSNMY